MSENSECDIEKININKNLEENENITEQKKIWNH